MSEETTSTQATGPETESNGSGEEKGLKKTLRERETAINAVIGEQKFKSRRRRKVSYLTINKIDKVDYKEVSILRRFLNDRGKILSSKHTGNTAKQQRMIAQAIRRAREMALIPFVVTEIPPERPPRPRAPREYGERRDYNRYDGPPKQQNTEQPAEAAPAAASAEE